MIIIDHSGDRIVDAIAHVVAIMWNSFARLSIFQLRASSGFQAVQSFRVEPSIVAIAVFPVVLVELQTIGKGVLTLGWKCLSTRRERRRSYFFGDALLPVGFVLSAIRVMQNSVPVKFAIFELSFVGSAGWECEFRSSFESSRRIVYRTSNSCRTGLPFVSNLSLIVAVGPVGFIDGTTCRGLHPAVNVFE